MQAALDALRNAERELHEAEADKGGHRVRAERLVHDAISEVEKGIQFDRRH
jgi:TATA-binding protein-associated factor Taf7